MIQPGELMRLAIGKAQEGIQKGQTPFGCAIAIGDKIVAVSHNQVWSTTDITAHAEVTALREGCRQTGQVHLLNAMVATTCEPCPMCMAALHWARVDTVYFGATIADAAAAGFNELAVPAVELLNRGGSQVKLTAGLLRDECTALFDEWKAAGLSKRSY
jgi:tRNA(Arg) A34 adenosine deaminase TadA